jgi:hypothetical protein
LNTQSNTLHFFVDNTLLSHCITNIYSTPLFFGISAFNTHSSSVEVVSFLLLQKASVDNNFKCVKYVWERGVEEDRSSEYYGNIYEFHLDFITDECGKYYWERVEEEELLSDEDSEINSQKDNSGNN